MIVTTGEVDPIGRRYFQSLLDDQVCRSAHYCDTTASTNAWALADLANACSVAELPRLYFTDRQSAGRGRHGRSWQSSDQAIALSLVFQWSPDPAGPGLWSIAAGVAVARAIEFTCAPLQTKLKWPNDVYIDSGKVAGILIETNQHASDRVVVGVGINVNAAPNHADLLSGMESGVVQSQVAVPKSLAAATGRALSRFEVMGAVVQQLVSATQELSVDPTSILNDFRVRCLLAGSTVSVSDGGGRQTGECLGITDRGELAIQLADRIHHSNSGEAYQVRIS